MLKNNNIFKKNKEFFLPFICTFCLILSLSIFVSFSSNTEVQEVIVKSMTPVYDENSSVVITEDNGVIFNDKDQVVKYNVVIENTQNYDVKISDIKLSTPSEEFLKYEVEGIDKEDVIKANETKELVVSFETVKTEGWGRNFSDELTANITFDKLKKNEEPVTPEDDKDKEEPKQEEVLPEDDKDKEEPKQEEVLPEEDKTTTENNTNNGTGNTESDKKEETPIVESKPSDKEEKPQTSIDKNEPVIKEETTIVPDNNDTEEDTNTESESIDTEHELKPAPETKEEATDNSNVGKTILIIVGVAAGITGITIVLLNKNKFAKYTIFIVILGSTLTITNAEDVIQLPITLNVSFESQNVMKMAYTLDENDKKVFNDYWAYSNKLKTFNIANELSEITEYAYKFDVSEEGNERVIAYLVPNADANDYYDLYLQADGIIYPNTNASHYFSRMINLYTINNLAGFDTSYVADMSYMFSRFGYNSTNCTLDLSSFDTSNVTNMNSMFSNTGFRCTSFILDVSSFDTSNVTNMSSMFSGAGYLSPNFILDVSNFDTRKVTDMSYMFASAASKNTTFELDVSNFDTSNVTNMRGMFSSIGIENESFVLDLSNFNTNKVTDMSYMFNSVGITSKNLILDLSSFNTSKVENMSYMFASIGKRGVNIELDLSEFNTSNVTDMSHMFYQAGVDTTNFNINVSNFDTSNVTDMSHMFHETGLYNPNFTIDVSNFNTSKVTDMSYMFDATGKNNPAFVLDVTNFDTSQVTNMEKMFHLIGYSNPAFVLDVSNFDTSKVTNMSSMFSYAGYSNSNFALDVTNFDTSNVTDMSWMFNSVGNNTLNFKLDLSNFDTSKVTDMSNMFSSVGENSNSLQINVSNFDTRNVTDMSYMFQWTGCNSIELDLDTSNFDTSKVTNTREMFAKTGYYSTNFKTSITIKNPNITDYKNMFYGVATFKESQMTVNYTSETSDLVDKMILTKNFTSANVVKGKLIVDIDNPSIGDEIAIGDEKFNVIGQTDETITMFAQYNISPDYKQSTTEKTVPFSNTKGWEYTPGPKEIDIYTWSTEIKTYIDSYVSHLQTVTGDTTLHGDLITLNQLQQLECTIKEDYASATGLTCTNSQYSKWLVNNQSWWTKSASSEYSDAIWHSSFNGYLGAGNYEFNYAAIRPTITISKEALKNYLKT